MVKNSEKKKRTRERRNKNTSKALETQRLKKHQRKMESFWRHNQIDHKQGQTLDGMSPSTLEEADDEYDRVESDYHTEMNKKYKEAAEQFCDWYISTHGWKSYRNLMNSPYRYYDGISVTLVVNGKATKADLLSSLGEYGFSCY